MSLALSLPVSSIFRMSNNTQQTFAGIATARGYAIGPVFIYRDAGELPVPEYLIDASKIDEEMTRLTRARMEAMRDLEGLISVLKERTGKEDVKVFECHLMLLDDDTLCKEADGYIRNEHLNAEAAVRKTANHARAQFARMNDPYFRERVRDLDDVERRLQEALAGFSKNKKLDLKSPSIIVADDLTPSETIQLPRELVLGFALNKGSMTSHVALLARSLAIPSVCGLGDITARVKPGETLLLDGTNGAVTLSPTPETCEKFEVLIARQKALVQETGKSRRAGSLKDGEGVTIQANIQRGADLSTLAKFGAQGVGLYRSEYLWLDREREPTEEEQFEAYRTVIAQVKNLCPEASTTIRMLDIGGDKLVKGISAKELNPFLGNRSTRYLLVNPAMHKTQLRAVLRASAYGATKIMYPMISCLEEMQAVLRVVDSVKRELDDQKIAYDRRTPIGAMIEVPSAALIAEDLAEICDFFSLGTNDLIQYTMAADRGNESVAHLYQPFNPAVTKLVTMTINAARQKGIPVSVCGESASDPVAGIFWAALGVQTLSMSATYIPPIACALAQLTQADLAEYALVPSTLHSGATGTEIAEACHSWLARKVPDFEDVLL